MTKALVVLSGGQDSTTCLAWAKQGFTEVHAISFDYGQRHRIELDAAAKVATILQADSHVILPVQVVRGASPLTTNQPLETYSDYESMDKEIGNRVELTYVPHRNLTFLLEAAKYAEQMGIRNLVAGVCQADNANYPDCREMFVRSLETTLNLSLGTDRGDRGKHFLLHAPLLNLSKAESIRLAQRIPDALLALSYSHTCYAGECPPCGTCHACVLRAEGFRQAGIADPLLERLRLTF
jgi:7-cyano-7-deazaguanine synthase